LDGGKSLPLFDTVEDAWHEAHGQRNALVGLAEDDEAGKQALLQESELALADVRLVGDLVIAAFLSAEKDKEREARRLVLRQKVDGWRRGEVHRSELETGVAELRRGEMRVTPFHWEVEFPEVFDRTRSGFDVIVGNPPFLNGTRISTRYGDSYSSWLLQTFQDSNGKADLVAFFLRQAFSLLRFQSALGMVATITISMGDTREASLEHIVKAGGVIYAITKRIPWPGQAAVTVSTLNIAKGVEPATLTPTIDGNEVERISTFLLSRGPDTLPPPLQGNIGICFSGPYVMGAGFLFDDDDDSANPISEMAMLISSRPELEGLIRPYICGEELLTDPRLSHRRYVIYLGEMEQSTAWQQYPELMRILERRVKPERINKDAKKYPRMVNEWWKFWNPRHELMSHVTSMKRILMTPFIAKHFCFGFVPASTIVGTPNIVVCSETYSSYCSLQGRVHESWVRFLGSTMEDRQRYTPSDCFETFPFPRNWQTHPALETAGEGYYLFRANLMVRNNEGLTKTYNRFHDPDERHPDILRLRQLHEGMDRAVLDAYGWTDIATKCDFFLEYEIDEETWGNKKKPYRYRWPDEVHDEVLARLLDLNQKRAQEEALAGARETPRPKKPRSKKQAATETPLLPV
jgi:hypothetical protein